MTGLRLTIPTKFSDASLPILRADPILSAGSLALYEPAHPANYFSGSLANGTFVPNIAGEQAKALMPGASDAALSAFGYVGQPALDNPAKIKIERSTKGGMHVIVAKTDAVYNVFAGLYGRARLTDYLRANIGHEFYVSTWQTETRSAITGAGSITALSYQNALGSTALHWTFSRDGNNYPTTAKRTGFAREVNGAPLGGQYADSNATWQSRLPAKIRASIAVKGTDSVMEKDGASVEASRWFKLFSAGAGQEIFGSPQTGPGSTLFYRFYIEDLTVSGRTFADVDALDRAEHAAQVLTVGGRYYGDTYTDPASYVA